MWIYIWTGNPLQNAYIGEYVETPSGYQEVEYIQSSWTQFINTGYVPNNNTKVRLSMDDFSSVWQYNNLFGARYNWWSWGQGFLLGYDTWLVGDQSYFAMFNSDYGGISVSTFSFTDGNSHIIEMSQSWIYEDNSKKQNLSTTIFTAPWNLYIFCDNDRGTANEFSSYKLKSFKIYTSTTLERDFVPMVRNADNVAWLYDTINDVFYTNAGSWTFTKWPDV